MGNKKLKIKKDVTKDVPDIEMKKENIREKFKKIIFNKFVLLVFLIVVLAIVSFFVIKMLFFNKSINSVIAFVENEQLILYDSKSNEKKVIEEKFDIDDNSILTATWTQNFGKFFAYIKDDSLYLYDVKKDKKEKITSGMNGGTIVFSQNGKYLIYQDDEKNLYSYNIKSKEKNKVINGDLEVYFEIVNNYLYIYSDNNIYFKDLNSNHEKEKIASGEVNYIDINDDGTKIIYTLSDNVDLGTYSVYVYDVTNGEKDKVLTNITSFNSNEDFSEFIYLTNSKHEVSLLDDDELNNDSIYTEFKTCTYSEYIDDICTYEQWLYEETIEINISKKDVNDEIRDYVKNNVKLYDVYYKKNTNDEKLLALGVSSVLSSNINNKTIVYKKYTNDLEKIKISVLQNLEEFEEYLSGVKTTVYYSINGRDEIELSNMDDFNINDSYILDNNDIYLVNDSSNSELYYYDKNNNKLILLDEQFTTIYKEKNNYLLYLADYSENRSTYTLKQATGSKVTSIMSNISNLYDYEDIILLINECEDNYICDLYKMTGTNTQKLTDNVFYAIYLENNDVFLLKNYSENRGTADIYIYDNGKIKNIALDVDLSYVTLPTNY